MPRRSDVPDFEAFVVAELSRLHKLAWALTRNEHDAWDLVQECFARMKPKWAKISERENPGPYARKVLVNLNLNRLRKLRREVLVPLHADRAATSDDLARVDWLDQALAEMAPRQRIVATLAYVEDMPVVEIAQVLGCSQSSVKTHLARARIVLRAAASGAEAPLTHEGGNRP